MSGPSPESDEDVAVWLVAIARADREGFAHLFRVFGPKVKAYLMRHGGSPHAAEELTQEVFFAIWRKAAQFDPLRASAPAWIYTIARNVRVDRIRRERHPDAAQLDQDAIAQLMDLPLGTVKGRIRLATAHLKAALDRRG